MPANARAKTSRSKPAVTAPKLSLVQAVNIPLNQLKLADSNVRKVTTGLSIDALADSIARRSLLQSLSVRAETGDDGAPTGTYVVQAGGRRLRALQLLVKQKRLAADAPIPCVEKTEGLSEDDSLAENTDRLALHPLDQFRAFDALKDKGQSDDDIAAAYGVTPAVVKQRMRMASASPKVLAAFVKDEIDLEKLMAFCVTANHAQQNKVLATIRKNIYLDNARDIRKLMTNDMIPLSDKRVLFVGADAYQAAGGTVLRDLFSTKDDGYIEDAVLLEQLVADGLKALSDAHLVQGWKWVEAAPELPFSLSYDMHLLDAIETELSAKDKKRLARLQKQRDELYQGNDDDACADPARLAQLDRDIAALVNPIPQFSPADMARAGVLIQIGYDGQPDIEPGYVRDEDLTEAERGDADVDTLADDAGDDDGFPEIADFAPEDSEYAVPTDLPGRLIEDLTAYRTYALRDAVGQDFQLAFLAALHALAGKCFYGHRCRSAAQIATTLTYPEAPATADMTATKAVRIRHDAWRKLLPDNPRQLWGVLTALDEPDRHDLFAHCVSLSLTAVQAFRNPERGVLRHADQLATAAGLDMTAAGFVPTVETFFGRITKPTILATVREATDETTASGIAHMKKPDMAKQAQRLVAGTGWLPSPLRAPQPSVVATPNDGVEANDNAADTLADAAPIMADAAE